MEEDTERSGGEERKSVRGENVKQMSGKSG